MNFKPIRYNKGEEIVEIKVRDTTGAEIAKWIVMISDFPRAVAIIKKKFGLDKIRKEGDLDWALQQ